MVGLGPLFLQVEACSPFSFLHSRVIRWIMEVWGVKGGPACSPGIQPPKSSARPARNSENGSRQSIPYMVTG